MSRLLCLAILAVGLPTASLPAQNPSDDPLGTAALFDFEDPYFQAGDVDGQSGWWVDQGVASVLPGLGWNGSSALSVEPAEPFSQGRLTLLRPDSSASGIFLDFHVRLAAAEWFVLDETFDIDSARIGLFRTTDDPFPAQWHVFHGNGAGDGMWLNTGVAGPVDPVTGSTIGWTRLTIREDLSDYTWDFWVDGVPTAAGLGFQFPPEPDHIHFYILGDTQWPVILDDVLLSTQSPPGLTLPEAQPPESDPSEGGIAGVPPDLNAETLLDSDADGLPDVWEDAHGLNALDATDAATDLDGDGLTALDEFILGSDVAKKDVRRSVVANTAEVFNRFAGVSVRRAVVPAP